MNFLNGRYYVEVKDKRYRIHPTENIIVGLWVEPKTLRTQYHVQNETQIRKNQIVIKNYCDELVVKNYPKIKELTIIQQQPKITPPNFPCCKRNNYLEFDKG